MTSQELQYTVPGMSCGHCERAVRTGVERVAGVEGVTIDLDTKLVAVRGEGMDELAVRAAIAEAGYEVNP